MPAIRSSLATIALPLESCPVTMRRTSSVMALLLFKPHSTSCLSDRAPQFFGRRRQRDWRGADRGEGVVDRVHHRRDRADRAGFADALNAERVLVGRGYVLPELEGAEIVGARHAIILERPGDELTALGVVDQVLQQRLAEPLDDAAVDLPLAQKRVQHVADIVDRAVARERHLAGLAVDLDFADMRARREGRRVGRSEIGALGKPGLDILGELRGLEGLPRDLVDRERAVGAGDREMAAL